MYQTYFEERGFNSVIIRGGRNVLELAMMESASFLTLDSKKTVRNKQNKQSIYIFTHQNRSEITSEFELKSAVISSEVFNHLNKLENLSSTT